MPVEIIAYADEDGISAKRLATFVETNLGLARDIAIVLGIPSDVLTFKYFDSESDLLVGIKCGKEIAETLNTLLRQVWEKFRFWRYDTFEKKMESISKGLEVVDRIHESVQKGGGHGGVREDLESEDLSESWVVVQFGLFNTLSS